MVRGQIIYPDEAYKIVGACFEVYNRMGCGFLESVYQECPAMELCEQGLPCEAQKTLRLIYRGSELKQHFVADFVCFGKIILEIKAVGRLTDEHRGQVINYLHATGMKLGLLVSFGHYPKMEHERLVVTGEGARERIRPANHANGRE